MDFDKLYNTYYMSVYSYVMTIVKNAHMAEEITQQTFFKALNGKFDGRSGEYTWLCAIAKNAALDELKRQSKFTDLNEDIPSPKSVEQTAEDELFTLEIHRILHNIEEPYKEVFQLRRAVLRKNRGHFRQNRKLGAGYIPSGKIKTFGKD